MQKGVAVSPGIVVGVVHRVETVFGGGEPRELDDPALIPDEIARFDEALEEAAHEVETLVATLRDQVGADEAAIFESHLTIVRDKSLAAKVRQHIRDERLTALGALQRVMQDYAMIFARSQAEFFRERMADIRDVISRIGSHLTARRTALPDGDSQNGSDPVVLVAGEILPSQAMSLGNLRIGGIVTEVGGGTGHAAILARSRGIPAVSGVTGITGEVQDGDLIAVDGREGMVVVRPDPETASAYRKMQREYVVLQDRLIANRDKPAVSADGAPIDILANINNLSDAQAASAVGASGVGLYRTEYLYLAHPSVPDEHEQYEHYREVVEAAPNRTVTIRTLDLGGDKTVPYLGSRYEPNPFMGWRSIRLSLEHTKLFENQIRAILRAGAHGKVSMLFPMVTRLEELREVNNIVGAARAALDREGIAYGRDVKTGVMIEVPAAAVCIDAILRETDFISVGSNDLIQYLMAADRDNPRVAHLCEPLSPAIFRVLKMVFDACRGSGTPVTVCGEMAGRPRSALALFGLGLRKFSMSPAYVAPIKEVLSRVTTAQAERFAHQILQLKTSEDIRKYLSERLGEIAGDLDGLDQS